MTNFKRNSYEKTGGGSGTAPALSMLGLNDIRLNVPNLLAFVEGLHEHIPLKATDKDNDVYKDFAGAISNLRSVARAVPAVFQTPDVMTFMAAPSLLLDLGDINFKAIRTDIGILVRFVNDYFQHKAAGSKGEAVRHAAAFFFALKADKDERESCDRIAKDMALHYDTFSKPYIVAWNEHLTKEKEGSNNETTGDNKA